MASYTVQQLKTAVANIPAGANTWLIEVPDELILPVANSRSINAQGGLVLVIRGYFNFVTRTWVAVP
jgi:hypothetical protein